MYLALFVALFMARAASLDLVCGWHHNCVFERGQEAMKCWGRNDYGQLGYDDTNNRGDGPNEMGANLTFVHIGTGFVVEDMELGYRHSCAKSVDRAMKCFGGNGWSQLGFDGVTTTGDALPFLVFGADFNLSDIAVGGYHTCARSMDAALKCFGDNYNGQCGAGTSAAPINGPPSQINAIDLGTDFTAVDVQTFREYVCVKSQQGTAKCFGRNSEGQLGYGDTTQRGRTPASMGDGLAILNLGSDFIVAAIATGGLHSCALSTTKTVKCWGCGSSNYGQCGTPHSTETGDDLPVLDLGADFVPMQLALGDYHTCILAENATLLCFGRNQYGQLGLGHTNSVDTPSTLTGIDLGTGFVPRQVAAGAYHTCAVSTTDAIKCWGRNDYGQLGLGHANHVGDGANEMGGNLPFVDVDWPTTAPTTTEPTTAQPTTAAPTAAPTTKEPTTAVPTTTAPTSAAPTTAEPTTATPTTVSPTTPAPTTAEPTTAAPSTAPATTKEPTTAVPTTTAPPTTVAPTIATTLTTTATATATEYRVTIEFRSASCADILVTVADALDASLAQVTVDEEACEDEDDVGEQGSDATTTATLLVAIADVQLDSDVIQSTLREAMVQEYGEDIVDVGVEEEEEETQEQSAPDLDWLVTVALCIVSVCFCFAVAGVIKCILAKRRQHDIDNHNQLQAAQIELAERARPLPAAAAVPRAYGLQSESEVEEKKEEPGVNPGAGEPDLELEQSVSNRNEGRRRASVAAQTAAVTAGMAEDEFEVVDDHQTDAGYSANFVRAEATPAGMEEDEFEVVDDDDNKPVTAGDTRNK